MLRRLPGKLLLLFGAAALLIVTAGCPGRLRPGGTPVTVFVSGPVTLNDILTHGSLVGARRSAEPAIWLACGDVFGDRRAALLTRGEAQVRLLEAAGADAVVLGPEWLEFGPERLAELVEESRLQFLGANLVDTAGLELGHPLYVRQLDGAALGLAAVWTDSADARLRLRGVGLSPAGFAASKVLPLLKRRAEVVGIVMRPGGVDPAESADFAVGTGADGLPAVPVPGAGMLGRLELTIRGGRIAGYRAVAAESVVARSEPGLQAVLDSIRGVTDSLAGQRVTTAEAAIPPRTLADALVAGCVGNDADGFLHDRPLFRDSLAAGPVTVGRVIDLLEEPGRAALVTLTGRDIEALLGEDSVEAGWRKGVTAVRMPLDKEYRVMATLGFLARHPEAASGGFDFDERSLWERAADILGRQGRLR